MPADVIIDPSNGQIYWNDGGASPETISIKGDAQNAISFVGYSGSYSPGSGATGSFTLATFNDNGGTSLLVPGTNAFDLGSGSLRWNFYGTNANLSGTLLVADGTISSSLLTGSTRINGGIAISGNASIGQSLNFYSSGTANTVYTGFKAGLATVNTLYTLPISYPSTGTSVLQSDTTGTLIWVPMTASASASGGTVGSATQYQMAFYASTGQSVGGAVGITYNPTSGTLLVSNTTASTNTSTGALIVAGGVGISGQLTFARASLGYTSLGFNPSMSFIGNTTSSPITLTVLTDNSLSFEGTSGQLFGIDNNLTDGEIFSVNDISGLPIISASAGHTIAFNTFTGYSYFGTGVYNSANTTSGALVIYGGLGVTGNANIGGTVIFSGSTNSTNTTSGALSVRGGIGVTGNAFIGGTTVISNTSATSSSTTGALTVSGGVGIGQSLFVGGVIKTTNTTQNALNIADRVTVYTVNNFENLNVSSNYSFAFNIQDKANNNRFTVDVSNNKTYFSGNSAHHEIRFYNANQSTYTGFAATNVGTVTYFWPPGDGSAGQALHTNGSGRLYWSTPSGGSSSGSSGVNPGAQWQIGYYVATGASIDGSNTFTNDVSAGKVSINHATASLSFNSGALVVSGGVGIGGSLFVTGIGASIAGVTFNVGVVSKGIWAGTAISTKAGGTGQDFSSSTGVLTVSSGTVSATQFPNIYSATGTSLYLSATTLSTSASTGAFTVLGGVGIGQSASIGGRLQLFNGSIYTAFVSAQSGVNTTYILPATSPAVGTSVLQSDTGGTLTWVPMSAATGSGTVNSGSQYQLAYYAANGTAVSGSSTFTNDTVAGKVSITHNTGSNSVSTGALVVSGGVGIGGSLFTATGSSSSISGVILANNTVAASTYNKVTITTPTTSATLTLADGSSLITSGANSLTLTTTALTNVTLPTSGTLVNTSVTSLGSLTTASSLNTVGTITSGTWSATAITGLYGGTGYNSYTKGDILVGAGNTFIKLGVGADNFVLTASATSPSGLTWASVPPSAASSVAVTPTSLDQSFFITTTSSANGTGLGLSSIVSFVVNPSSGIVSASGIAVTNTTASTSSSTGSLVVSGGAGIAKSISIGGRLQLFNGANYTSFVSSASGGNTTYTLPTSSPAIGVSVLQSDLTGLMSWVPMSTGTGSGTVNSGSQYQLAYYAANGTAVSGSASFTNDTVAGKVSITHNTGANSVSTGALVVTGGVGIGGSLYTATGSSSSISGVVLANNTVAASTFNKVTITTPTSAATLTLADGSSLVTSGANSLTLTTTAPTNVTFPTSGTLVNTSVTSLASLTTASSLNTVGTITSGTWSATAITGLYGGTGYNSYTKGDILVGAGNTFIKLAVGADNFVLTASATSPAGVTWASVPPSAASTVAVTPTVLNQSFWIPTVSSVNGTGLGLSTIVSFVINPSTGIISASGLAITSTLESTSTTTGALTVIGGIGVTGGINVGGPSTFKDPTQSTSQGTGAVLIQGGLGVSGQINAASMQIAGNATVNGNLTFNGIGVFGNATTDTINYNARAISNFLPNADNTYDLGIGALGWRNIVISGFGTYAGGLAITSTTPALSTTSGSLIVSGGAGIAGSLYTGTGFSSSVSGVVLANGTVAANTYNKVTITTPATSSTLTIADGSSLITSGAFSLTLTTTATTNVTLPTSGTLVNTSVTTLSSLASIGTITTGTWNATAISTAKGGTGQDLSLSTGVLTISSGTVSASQFPNIYAATGTSLYLSGTNPSISSATGTLTVAGGVGIGGSVITSTSFASSISGVKLDGNYLSATGGTFTSAVFAANIRPLSGNTISILQTDGSNSAQFNNTRLAVLYGTNSTSEGTGALVVSGGVGIGLSASIAGRLQMFNGSNYTAFVSSASGGNTTYTLPPTAPSAIGTSVLTSTPQGVMTWYPLVAGASGGSPSGSVGDIQYNSGTGSFAASGNLNWANADGMFVAKGYNLSGTSASANNASLLIGEGGSVSGWSGSATGTILGLSNTSMNGIQYNFIDAQYYDGTPPSNLSVFKVDYLGRTQVADLTITKSAYATRTNNNKLTTSASQLVNITYVLPLTLPAFGSSVLYSDTSGNMAWFPLSASAPGGSGTVNSGIAGSVAYYSADGTAVSGSNVLSISTAGTSITANTNIDIRAANDLRLWNSGNTFNTGLQAGANSATYTLLLPTAPVSSGSSVVVTGADGQMYFASAGSGIAFSSLTNTPSIRVKRSLTMQFCAGYTPISAGPDSVILKVPESASDGITDITYRLRELDIRVETPSAGSSRIQLERYSGTTAFTLAATGSSMVGGFGITLSGAGTYSTSVSTNNFAGTLVTSNDKLRLNWTLLNATHANFSIQLTMEEL